MCASPTPGRGRPRGRGRELDCVREEPAVRVDRFRRDLGRGGKSPHRSWRGGDSRRRGPAGYDRLEIRHGNRSTNEGKLREALMREFPVRWSLAAFVVPFCLAAALFAQPEWQVVHDFDGPGGASPHAPLVLAEDGFFYGTTVSGGATNDGTVFRIDPEGKRFLVIHEFADSDGSQPLAGLVLSQPFDGHL